MQSNVLLFIAYAVIVAIILNLISNTKAKTVILFGATVFFYLLCDLRYFVILAASVVLSYFIAGMMHDGKIRTPKIPFIAGTVLFSLVLFFFKWSKVIFLGNSIISSILMPLGLSYYIFKIISYIADIYSGKVKEKYNFIEYFNYVAFFPQIICGPISRIEDLGSQIKNLKRATRSQVENGVFLILSGLFKKAVIADRISPYVTRIFASPDGYPALALWLAAFLYTVEIYCDFAGYSEIVIGICNIMGIECKPNFMQPYFSYSISDFWDRWHISLSTWLRDYVYIPLGGNRKGIVRKKINILLTFLISGIWHGAGLNFIIWGLWHGILSCLDIKKGKNALIRIIQTAVTFIAVMFGWIMFASSGIKAGFHYMAEMFRGFSLGLNSIIASVMPMTDDYSCLSFFLVTVMLIIFVAVSELIMVRKKISEPSSKYLYAAVFLILVIMFGAWGQSSFIYANF